MSHKSEAFKNSRHLKHLLVNESCESKGRGMLEIFLYYSPPPATEMNSKLGQFSKLQMLEMVQRNISYKAWTTTISRQLNLFGKSDWSINPWIPRTGDE